VKWMLENGSTFESAGDYSAVCSGSVDMLIYLQSIGHGDWSKHALKQHLGLAGALGHVEIVKWLRAQGAEWPDSSSSIRLVASYTAVCCREWLPLG
jgi:hypothetical protein